VANQRHNASNNPGGATTGRKGPKMDKMKESVPNWGGLPGKEGPERSNGVKKLNIHPQQKGL